MSVSESMDSSHQGLLHITNRHFNFSPLLGDLARELDKQAL